ncbi:phage portal protein [Marinobacterium lutimaris]|uniref:Phage portal protein, lambda family n=1 Tax=Marinobacterium lutimaris TaxID=568106 RepID=A0A1H5XLH8_9GAMM|nr:phage portal protein [Marinobacterium lutimaris]SEG12473.1 phage portal protein, lambda family [Marinobacterium lutimaris]
MNLIDKWYEVVKPSKAVERQRDRMMLTALRDYDAARPTRTSGGYKRTGGRAAEEAARGHKGLAGGAQDLVRNTAIGNRIKAVIASNMVGDGIKPNYIGGSERRVKKYKTTFDEWASSTACDYEGHYNLWGLQHLWAGTVVESGGVFIRRVMNNALAFPLVLQTLEQQYLDESKSGFTDGGGEIVSGIQYNGDGIIQGYWLKTRLTTRLHYEESKYYPASEIIHIYWKDRPGQHLGVSWYHPVADLINQRQEWRDATLLLQHMAACFGVIIKEPPKDMGLGDKSNPLRDEDGTPYSEIEKGMIAYVDQNTDITTVTPPNLNQTTDFNGDVLQDIAVGVGTTREQITGDFSKVTWASGRLARGEFYTNLDRWQNFMMLPGLNRVHDWFDEIYTVTSGKPNVTRKWVLPPRSAVNPKEELEVDIRKVRTGAMTPQQFTQKYGLKFEDAIEAWKEAKTTMGDLPFDFDPSKFSFAGNQLDNNDSASSNSDSNAGANKDDSTTDTPE